MNRTFLILIHLSSFHIFADSSDVSYVHVFRGESIRFSCNISNRNLIQVTWTNGRYRYTQDISSKNISSNFTLHRFNIDTNFTSTLTIIKAEDEDAGLYECSLNGDRGTEFFNWNLTVTENPKGKELSPPWPLFYILIPISGLLLLGFSSLICFCLKLKCRSSNQESTQDRTLSPDPQSTYSEIQMVGPQPHDDSDQRFSNKKRSQYIERLNSIYDPIR